MAETKTRPTTASVAEYLASRGSPAQIADCEQLTQICERITGETPRMWGPSIVGFGTYTYRYETGHSGESPLSGIAIRGREIVVYLTAEGPGQAERLANLGKHRLTKTCLYLKRLADIDLGTLEALIAASVAETQRRYPSQTRG